MRGGEPEGKRRSIMRPSLPNATLARARALFVFVVHTMHAMSGAMHGIPVVDMRCHAVSHRY